MSEECPKERDRDFLPAGCGDIMVSSRSKMDFVGVEGEPELFRFTGDFLFNLLGVLDGGGRILEERPQTEAPPGDCSCGVCTVRPVVVSRRP